MFAVKSIQGQRDYMEDCYRFINKDDILIALVCDGHGGSAVATETCNKLPGLLWDSLNAISGTNVKHAETIRTIIMNWATILKTMPSGSTLTGIAVKEDTIYVFNLGDSRTCFRVVPGSFIYMLKAVFNESGEFVNRVLIDYSQSQFFCTTDHNADSPFEEDRVKSSGGGITFGRLNGILSVTRALGDTDIGPGLGLVPDIYWIKKSTLDGPILMHSDGVSEPEMFKKDGSFSRETLYKLAAQSGPDYLVQYASKNNSEDNITAATVTF